MKKKILLLAALTAMLSACVKERLHETEGEGKSLNLTAKEAMAVAAFANGVTKIPESQIKRNALDAINIVTGGTTRAGEQRTIKELIPILRRDTTDMPVTRANISSGDVGPIMSIIPDTMAYIANFNDDMGYVIAAADTRVGEKILATVDHGNFSLADTVSHRGLAIFMDMTENYIDYTIAETDRMFDSLKNIIVADFLEDYPDAIISFGPDETNTKSIDNNHQLDYDINMYEYRTTVIEDYTNSGQRQYIEFERKDPLIPVEWGQGVPWNDLAPMKYCDANKYSNRRCPAGCAVIAGIQITAMYKYPPSFSRGNGWVAMDWDSLRMYSGDNWNKSHSVYEWKGNMLYASNTLQHQAAVAARELGLDLKTTYRCDGSSTYNYQLPDWLRDWGYKVDSKQDFNTETVNESIRAGRPVLIVAYRKLNDFMLWDLYTTGGHIWLIDGMIRGIRGYKIKTEIVRKKDGVVVETRISDTVDRFSWHHHNWGWEGDGNGYYNAGVFWVNQMMEALSDGTVGIYGGSARNNYKYAQRIWANIRR